MATMTTLPRIPCARVSAQRSAWLAPARWCLSMCLTLPSIRRTLPKTTVQVNSGVAVLDAVGVLLDKLTVKSGSTALTRDTDYTASFNNDGNT